jgi:hypothetical protein
VTRLAVVVALAASACATWRVAERSDEREPIDRFRIVLRDDLVSGRATLAADGSIEFALAIDHACVRIPQLAVHHVTTYYRRPSGLAFAALGIGTAAVLASAAGVHATPGPNSTDMPGVDSWALASAGVGSALFIGTLAVMAAASTAEPVTRETTDLALVDAPLADGRAPGRCEAIDPIAELGGLELATPWGTRAAAAFDERGVARFAVDWSAVPDDFVGLGSGWTVRATRRPVGGTWWFARDDVERMQALIRRNRR